MLLTDFVFDEQGTAGAPIDRIHWVDVIKHVDLNTEQFTFDILLTGKGYAGERRFEKAWTDLHPVEAQAVLFELFGGNYEPPVTKES